MKRAINGARTIAIVGALPLLASVFVHLAIGLLSLVGVTPPNGAYLFFFLGFGDSGVFTVDCRVADADAHRAA